MSAGPIDSKNGPCLSQLTRLVSERAYAELRSKNPQYVTRMHTLLVRSDGDMARALEELGPAPGMKRWRELLTALFDVQFVRRKAA
ncbi:MAG TPA: hypothetical protein VNM91_01155, partial [Dehalococcoidia bacterium]|nr:hypothetical protein [Dehalococcoidia bacterium]